jgi:CRISPR-associated protein Csx17
LFEMVAPGARPSHTQDVLISLGEAAKMIALRPKLQEALRPPPRLSRRWIAAADDGSPEFRLAVALAGLRAQLISGDNGEAAPARPVLPIRVHLGPLDPESRVPQWSSEKGRTFAVWGAGPLVNNLCAVAQRRLLEHTRNGAMEMPFDSAFDDDKTPIAVDSGEIATFLDGAVRDERIAELLLGLAWVQPGG